MPDWVVPTILALVGGSGIGGLVNALLSARGSAFTQLNNLVDQLQEDRKLDREAVKEMGTKVDTALLHLAIEREYSADLYAWGVNGAPPPPPQRRAVTPTH